MVTVRNFASPLKYIVGDNNCRGLYVYAGLQYNKV